MLTDKRIIYVNPRDLIPSRQNVRSDPGDLAGLAETIREHGILQPLGITLDKEGYRIVFGNRRRDAAIVVGLDRVPCVVLDTSDDENALVQQVLENLQRLDLNDMEKSRAFQHLIEHLAASGLAQSDALEKMARTLGLSVRQIQRYLRLQQLTPEVQALVAQGDLGVTHAQHLVDVEPATRQEQVASLVVEESLSAAELGRLCAALQRNTNVEPRTALEMLRRGQRVAVVEQKPREAHVPLAAAAPANEGPAADEWGQALMAEGEEGEEGEFPQPRRAIPPSEREEEGFQGAEPTTRDGNRVRRIHSLDAFMDELQRLTQCVQDGDLQAFLDEDDAPSVKLRLAVRQLRFLSQAIEALASA